MPQCFQFKRASDGELEKLPAVDDAIREYCKRPANAEKYSNEYHAIVYTGFAISMKYNTADWLTEEQVREFFEQPDEKDTEPEVIEAYVEFMARRYSFRSWYGH